MSKLLYPKLAAQNIRTNRRFYVPYILTIIGTVGAFYIMRALADFDKLPDMNRYAYLSAFMYVGTFVIALFAIIFLFYTNSFLMKRRKKELGLYNILGMGKRHIAVILGYETLYIAILGIGLGLLFGMLFQKLVSLLLIRMISVNVYYTFYISYNAVVWTVILFSAILLLTLLFNLRRIHVQNPIELLSDASAGEREPKTKWVLTALGIISLGAGYYIAVSTENAVEALALYFVAVFLVIIGTYCLFTAVSISILKLLRQNKRFYYRTRAFIGVSGMLYRMKRNAVGLANICILSTMVLVMVSGTLSLYMGTQDSIAARCPADIVVETRYPRTLSSDFDERGMINSIRDICAREDINVTSMRAYRYLSVALGEQDGRYFTNYYDFAHATATMFCFMTAREYETLTGETATLDANSVWIYGAKKNTRELSITFDDPQGENNPSTLRFNVDKQLSSFPISGGLGVYLMDHRFVVVADDDVLNMLFECQSRAYREEASRLSWIAEIDVSDDAGKIRACTDALYEIQEINGVNTMSSLSIQCQDELREEYLSVNGGFFFLGMFLGLVFIMAMVLIIYYKQISEGYEDRERYQIMRKVGLPKRDIRASVNAQIRVVFFAPLLIAAVHIAFDYQLMIKLLSLFGLTNVTLTFWCSVFTLAAFTLIYGGVYALTTRTYLKIVS